MKPSLITVPALERGWETWEQTICWDMWSGEIWVLVSTLAHLVKNAHKYPVMIPIRVPPPATTPKLAIPRPTSLPFKMIRWEKGIEKKTFSDGCDSRLWSLSGVLVNSRHQPSNNSLLLELTILPTLMKPVVVVKFVLQMRVH